MSEENKIEETEEMKDVSPIDEYLNNYKEQKLAEFCVQKDKEIASRKEERQELMEQIMDLKKIIKIYNKKVEEYDMICNSVQKLYCDVIKELSVKDYLELYHMISEDISGNKTTFTIGTTAEPVSYSHPSSFAYSASYAKSNPGTWG